MVARATYAKGVLSLIRLVGVVLLSKMYSYVLACWTALLLEAFFERRIHGPYFSRKVIGRRFTCQLRHRGEKETEQGWDWGDWTPHHTASSPHSPHTYYARDATTPPPCIDERLSTVGALEQSQSA